MSGDGGEGSGLEDEGRRRPIAGMGLLRIVILRMLMEKGELTGYDIIKEIERKTGYWRPSPGTVYPLLRDLESRGIVARREEGRRKVYYLTPGGRELASKLEEARVSLRRDYERFVEAASVLLEPEIPEDVMEALREVKAAIAEAEVHLSNPGVREKVVEALRRAARDIRHALDSLRAAEF
ncbi:MAG: hypothetical protein DRO01_03740 [Thermoproteota archaeon]|nr:MAG: hypothetical protein DRO01_03740 [Candidatus Korarchaeota archaeon]